jgi:hypothetical protein
MPKNKSKKSSRRSRNHCVSGTCLVSFTAGTAVVSTQIAPGPVANNGLGYFSPKLLALSSCYQLFRFTKLAVEMNPANFVISAAGAAGLGIIGYSPDQNLGTLPTTPVGVVDLSWRTPYCGNGNTTGTGSTVAIRRTVPKNLLHGQNVQWFNTRIAAGTPNDFLFQGTLYCWGSTFAALGSGTFLVDYTCEFKDFIDPTFVPRIEHAPFCGQDLAVSVSLSEKEQISGSDFEEVKTPVV